MLKDVLSPEENAIIRDAVLDQAAAEREAGVAYFDGGKNRPNQRVWCDPFPSQYRCKLFSLLPPNPPSLGVS